MYRLFAIKRTNTLNNIKSTFSIQRKRPSDIHTSREDVLQNNVIGCQFCRGYKLLRQPAFSFETLTPQAQKLAFNDAASTLFFTESKLPWVRHQSSTTTTTHRNTETDTMNRKKRRKRNLKFVELLEVTDKAANERKSRVRRLKTKKLQEFIAKTQAQILAKRAREKLKGALPEVAGGSAANRLEIKPPKPVIRSQPMEYQKLGIDVLDNSFLESGAFDDKPLIFSKRFIGSEDEMEKILKSFHHFRDIIETMESEALDAENSYNNFSTTELKLVEDDSALETLQEPESNKYLSRKSNKESEELNLEAAVTKKSKKRFKPKIQINEEHEFLAKERALRINLSAYLSVCVTTGMMNRALSTLLFYRQRSQKVRRKLITMELYNLVLHGFAEKGSYDRFKEIYRFIEEDGLRFNEQTFAAIFECLGRLEPSEENIRQIESYIQKADKMGFTLDQIMDRSEFLADQRDIALDALQRVYPDFKPKYTPPQLGYNNVLLNALNKNLKPIQSEDLETEPSDGTLMNAKQGYSKEWLQDKAREQLAIELDGSITIKSIEKAKEYENAEFCREKLKQMEVLWRSQICSAIVRDLSTLRAQLRFKPPGYMNYYTYLKTLEPSQYADILLKEIYKLAEGSETYSPSVSQLYRELGQQVQKRYLIEQKKHNGVLEKVGEIYSSYCESWQEPNSNDNSRQKWQRLVHKERESGPSMNIRSVEWPFHVLVGVGRFLYQILMRDIKIDTNVMRQKVKTKHQNFLPAFYTLFRNQARHVKEELKPHPVLARLLRASRQQMLTFDSNLVPMLCPPQPWSTPHNGGYLLNRSDLIRLPHQAIQQWERIDSSNPQDVYPSLDSLNQLASIPWRVNNDILDVIIEVFQNGGDAKLDVPQPPMSLPPLPTIHKDDASVDSAERAKLFREKLMHRRKQGEMYSLWCDTLYRLSLANHYRDKVFWLPHNMDFRGRVYPIPPHLNHLGSDLARSILVFDEARPLGPDGFSWLKLHCINLTGLKKRDSIRERLLYAEDIMSEILDSADNPLKGRMWWAKSDEPWQTLACCIEIAKVHRSSDKEGYMSRFPIHQDGSCNGLQHYAALGRDKAGAFSVNLSTSEVPQDVYSAVAALVEKSRQSDEDNGLLVAQALKGFVRRKVIKQTVMTTVYGVTRYGARLQIARQLKDIDDFPKDWVWPASTYLTTKTFESLREMFTSTREIQDWFTDCARLISGVGGQNVEWVTPLGLPVVQPYSRQEARHSKPSFRVPETMSMDLYDRPNVLKQKNAFPPNFIHSLDSSHMMLTSLHCERSGLTFVSVHDCFWTHACTVPDMNKICREQFVSLHSQPILEDLSRYLSKRFSFKDSDLSNDGSIEDASKRQLNRVLRKLPNKGDFDLRQVLKSIYFFS